MTPLLAQAAEATKAAADPLLGKGLMIGLTFGGAALALGIIGASYMTATGRNPEASRSFGQLMIFVAMIEVTILLAFLLGTFLLK